MRSWSLRLLAIMALIFCLPLVSWGDPLSATSGVNVASNFVEHNTSLHTAMPIKGYVQKTEGKYTLSPGDVVSLKVYGIPEFDQENITIRPDGFMTVNPIGEVDAAGMDIDTLSATIQEKMKRYLKKPQVSMTVTKFHPAIVYVLGAVQKPGAYEIHGDTQTPDSANELLVRGRLTVSNLIANAGGITQFADLNNVVIKNNATQEQRTVNLLKLLREGDITQDIVVRSGDTIMVQATPNQMDDETFKLATQSALAPGTLTVRVLGKVNTPGVYTIPAQSPGINSAIASARGLIIDANQENIKVMRMAPNGSLSTVNVDPQKSDFVLRDNDVVVVDERRTPLLGRGFDFATRVMMPFVSVGTFTNAVLDVFNPERRFPFAR